MRRASVCALHATTLLLHVLLPGAGASGVLLSVLSPVEGTTYYASLEQAEVTAEVDIAVVGEGDWSAAIQASLADFELCVHWGTGSGGRGDGGKNKGAFTPGPACVQIGSSTKNHSSGMPNLKLSEVAPGAHTFVAYIQPIPGSASDIEILRQHPFPKFEVKYRTASAWKPDWRLPGVRDHMLSSGGVSDYHDESSGGASQCWNVNAQGATVPCAINWVDPAFWTPGEEEKFSDRNSSMASEAIVPDVDMLISDILELQGRLRRANMDASLPSGFDPSRRSTLKMSCNDGDVKNNAVSNDNKKSRQDVSDIRAALKISKVVNCSLPDFEKESGPSSFFSDNGAHWTSRPVGTCSFSNVLYLDGRFLFVFDGQSQMGPTLPQVRLSPYDDTTTVYCNSVEKKIPSSDHKKSEKAESSASELFKIDAIHIDALAAQIARSGKSLLTLSGQTRRGRKAEKDGKEMDEEPAVVVPLRRVHTKNHGHMFMDSAAAAHWALSLVGVNATSRPVYIMFLDGRGRGPYDNRLRMLTKNEAIYPEEALAFGTCPPGVACILPLVVAGVGGLGLHGCEYGIHPHTFRARREAILGFREHVISELGLFAASSYNQKEMPKESSALRVLIVQRHDVRRFTNLPSIAKAIASEGFALEVATFDELSLEEQLLMMLAADILIAVDGTAIANAPFMRSGSGVVAIGRACSKDGLCFWILQHTGPNWYNWVHDDGAFQAVRSSQQSLNGNESYGCSPSFANRLCLEMWRPHVPTIYVETPPGAHKPYAANVDAIVDAVRAHAKRMRDIR